MSDRWVLGVDIGGTNLVVAAVPYAGGEIGALRTQPTQPERGAEASVNDIESMAEEVIAEASPEGGLDDFVGVGIGCPGPLDLDQGIILSTPNLGWDGYPIRGRVGEAVGLPASLDNDANCATYGEWWQGAARGLTSVVGVTLGTGIGGGLITEGHLVRGASGSAGEIGHMTIQVDGRQCGCGNLGCLEAYASGPNIALRAREGLDAGAESILSELVAGDLDRITAATVHEALTRGDRYAGEVIRETARYLGVGIANLVNLFNPEMVVVVGGVTRADRHLFDPLRSEVRKRAFASAVNACEIVAGALPQTAGVIGAAGIFLADSSH
ncbi:MAG: ROK family protein [Gemmatimonadetes bacterium]|nr:ROK family protein [Gemmatimonadota bacterium]